MKINRYFFVLALVFTQSTLYAQTSYTFKVLVSKGQTELKSGTNWSPLKVGAALKATDEIKLADHAYLGLINANGKPLELKESGTHKVVDLAKRMGQEKSVLNKYTDFILSSQESKRNRLSATGAVHRGERDQIMLFLPESPREKVYGDRIVLNWKPLEGADAYIIIFKTLFEEELIRIESETNTLEVDLNQKALAKNNELMVKVLSKSNPASHSTEFAITRLTGKEKAAVKKDIADVSSSLVDNSALSRFYMAGVFEEKLLVIDAITAYQDAARMEPEIVAYRDAYEDFLKRLGFKLED